MKSFFLLATLFLGLCHGLQAETVNVRGVTYNFDDPQFKSIFDRTLIMGHMISANLLPKPIRLVPSPGDVLAESYAGKPVLTNLSEPIGMEIETGLQKISRYLFHLELAEGNWQRRIGSMSKAFGDSTAIVGIDAFYMDVVFNACADYPDVSEYNNPSIADRVHMFIETMHAQGKVLILGNVPSEDWNKVALVPRLVLENKNESCRQLINTTLRQYCTPDKNCYVVDLEKIVYQLNTTGELILKSGQHLSRNRFYLFNQVRGDGINLTPWGVQVIVEDVFKSVKANPPHASGNNLLQQP